MHDCPVNVRCETPWLLPAEAAAYLGVALGTLRNWTSQRSIPFVKRGRVVRYQRKALDHWLATGTGQPEPVELNHAGTPADGASNQAL